MNLDKKTKMVAGCGVALAVLAGYALYTATSKAEGLVPVVVATQNIDPRVKISEDMVQIEQKPALGRSSGMLDDTQLVVGGYATTKIFAGQDIIQPMVSKQFDPTGASGYAGAIPDENLRAISFPVTPEKAAGGRIAKGDQVDLIATFQPNENSGGNTKLTKVILQGVEVFDVGGKTEGDTTSISSITLLLTLEQAEIVQQIGSDNIVYALSPGNAKAAKTVGAIDQLICKRYNFNCTPKK